jgi:hypothetical protein
MFYTLQSIFPDGVLTQLLAVNVAVLFNPSSLSAILGARLIIQRSQRDRVSARVDSLQTVGQAIGAPNSSARIT